MPGPQTAVRESDEITHSAALFGSLAGIVAGLVAGAVIGALIVGTGGAAAIVFIAGASLVGGSIGGMFGKIFGKHSTSPSGTVASGSPNVIVGFDKKSASRALADVAHCLKDAGVEPSLAPPGSFGKLIMQGSGTVFINGFHAAREGDKGSCDFTLGPGWSTVIIGGPTVTLGPIDAEVPVFVDYLITGMGIVGTALLMWPGAVAMFGAGTLGGLGLAANLTQVGLRLGAQIYVGTKLSEVGGAIGHGAAHLMGAEDGSLTEELATLTGATAAPFAGGKLYKGIAEAPLPGMEGPGAAPRGPTGARTKFDGTPPEQARADAAYDRIRADNGDAARIADNTGYPEENVARVKDHLFNDQHEVLIGDSRTGDLQTSRQNFEPDPWIADRWTKASDGTLGEPGTDELGTTRPNSADPKEVPEFRDLLSHEYVEQGLMGDGLPYRSAGSWRQGRNGWHFYPDAQNAGAHDLAPLASPGGRDPFAHYEAMGRSSEGIPRPNENLSNLDEVLNAIRRTQGPGGEPFTPPDPLSPNSTGGGGVVPTPEAAPVSVPRAVAAEGSPPAAAPEDTAPLGANAPAAPTPEPTPMAAPVNTVPANPKYIGGPTAISRTNPNGGHLPADFGLHTIAESPQELALFLQALKNKEASSSPRSNAYQRYLRAIGAGETPTYEQANDAWSVIQQEYFKLARNAGMNMDDVQVHHWNFSKGDFPLEVTDPRNLVHTPDRQTSWNSHQAVHEATSSTTDIWSGPVEDIHQLPIDNAVFPLVPTQPPTP